MQLPVITKATKRSLQSFNIYQRWQHIFTSLLDWGSTFCIQWRPNISRNPLQGSPGRRWWIQDGVIRQGGELALPGLARCFVVNLCSWYICLCFLPFNSRCVPCGTARPEVPWNAWCVSYHAGWGYIHRHSRKLRKRMPGCPAIQISWFLVFRWIC